MNNYKITSPLRVDIYGGVNDILNISKIMGTYITNIALEWVHPNLITNLNTSFKHF